MNVLKLEYIANVEQFTLHVYLDSKQLEFKQTNNSIEILCDLTQGFHMLTLSLVQATPGMLIEFKSAELDGLNFKHTFYTMFSKATSGQTTCLSVEHNELCLPFMNPLVWWFNSCAVKIPSKYYAGDLYNDFSVYYPDSITPKKSYSKLITDYFTKNMDFYVHPKYSLDESYFKSDVPYVLLTNKIQYDEQSLAKEFLDNLEFLMKNSMDYLKKNSSDSDNSQGTHLVTVINVRSDGSDYDLDRLFQFDKEKFPVLYKFFKQLQIDDIAHAFIGVLAPGEAIKPHVDSYVGYDFVLEKYPGCNKVYIPINFKPGNYFKIANVGNIPIDQGPILINTHKFVHGLINDSDEYRFAIGFIGSKLK